MGTNRPGAYPHIRGLPPHARSPERSCPRLVLGQWEQSFGIMISLRLPVSYRGLPPHYNHARAGRTHNAPERRSLVQTKWTITCRRRVIVDVLWLGIMGISSYYEVVPQSLIHAVARDSEIANAIDAFWGHGSGMYAWFDEFDESEIAEILQERRVSQDSLSKLRELLSQQNVRSSAYIEKTHDEHENMLRTEFEKLGSPNAERLASVAIFGEMGWDWGTDRQDTAVSHVSNARCQELAALMKRIDISQTVQGFELGDRTPVNLWQESLESELSQLVDCYCEASENGHRIITGVT